MSLCEIRCQGDAAARLGESSVELPIKKEETRVTMLFNPATAPQADYYRRAVEAAAPPLGMTTRAAPVGDMRAIESGSAGAAQDRGAGPTVLPDTYTFTYRDQIVSLANRARLPAVYPFTPFADAGGTPFVWH